MPFFLPARCIRGVVTGCAALSLLLAGCADSESTSTESQTSAVPDAETVDRAEVSKSRVQYYTGSDADADQNWADLYLPAGEHETDSVPLVVLIHGGAWKMPLGAEIFDDLAGDLAARGMAVYNVEYRRVGAGGGWPATFHDVARALDHIIEIDKEFPELTVDDEVVVGHSAGAQLATWAGTRHKRADDEVGSHPAFRPTRVVSLAGPLDMKQAVADGDDRIVAALGGTPAEVPDRYSAVDPIENIDRSIPVAAVHGTRDRTVFPHNSERYIAELRKQGGQGRLLIFDGEDHTSIVNRGSDPYEQIVDLVVKYADAPRHQLQ